MNIICFGDVHSATSTLQEIEHITEADMLVLTGDLTNFGGKREVSKVLEDCRKYNPNILAQFGNLDRPDVNHYLEELDINLHAQARLVNERLCLVGIGGSNRTPFHTPSEFSEEDMLRIGKEAFAQAAQHISLANTADKKTIPLVLVSHTPPFGTTVDRLYSGRHAGSKAVRQLIEQFQPEICVCGHIHESRGEDMLGRTKVYNPGMLRESGWLHLHLDHSHITATLS